MGVSGGWSEEAAMETSAILTMSASPSPSSSSSACGCKGNISSSPVNTQCKQELESLMFEGGSDVFTSNRHALHNNEAKTFNLLTYRTQDDAPVHLGHGAGREGGLREGHQAHAQVQHSVGEACSSLDPGRSLSVWRYSLFEGAQEQCSSFTVIVAMFLLSPNYRSQVQ